jgi:FixJ family two-component response regulator
MHRSGRLRFLEKPIATEALRVMLDDALEGCAEQRADRSDLR